MTTRNRLLSIGLGLLLLATVPVLLAGTPAPGPASAGVVEHLLCLLRASPHDAVPGTASDGVRRCPDVVGRTVSPQNAWITEC